MQKPLTGRPVGRFANLYQEIVQANTPNIGRGTYRNTLEVPEPENQRLLDWLQEKANKRHRVPRKFKKQHTILSGRRNRDRRPRATGILYFNLDMDQQTMDRLHRALEVQHRLNTPIMVSSPGNGPAVMEIHRVRILRIINFSTH